MGLVIPPNHRNGDLGVMPALEISREQCKDIINLHKDSQNPQKKGKLQKDESNVVNISQRDTDVWVIHENNT